VCATGGTLLSSEPLLLEVIEAIGVFEFAHYHLIGPSPRKTVPGTRLSVEPPGDDAVTGTLTATAWPQSAPTDGREAASD